MFQVVKCARVVARASRASSLLMAFALTGCGTLSVIQLDKNDAGAVEFAHTGDLKAEVDSLAQPLIESGQTPGVMVGVLTADGTAHFYGYGMADKDSKTLPDADTLFAIGSLSKGFLGDITAFLVDEGALSWDDTLEKLLPPGTPLSADARTITVLQLATHTSGLPRQPMNPQTLAYFIQYEFTGRNFYRQFDTAYVLDYLADFKRPVSTEPEYSNIGYGLLGYIIEQRTGRSLDSLLQEKIAGPLGLVSTGYEPETLPGFAQRARGYVGDHPLFMRRGTPAPDFQFTELMKGSAAVYSDARDLLAYAAAHLRDDGSHYHEVLAGNLQVRARGKEGNTGIAWFEDQVDGERINYQEGLVAGYQSYIGLDLAHHTAVVVLQNSFNFTFAIGHRLLIRMAKAQELNASRDSAPTSAIGASG